MQNRAKVLLAVYIAAHGFSPITAQPQSTRQAVYDFAWLEGCWVSSSGDTREEWHAPASSLLFGFNTLTVDGEIAFFETLRLDRLDGDWVYTADPRGAGATAFELSEFQGETATFVNSEHDYPQRIRYARTGNILDVEISRRDGSGVRNWSFRSCESG